MKVRFLLGALLVWRNGRRGRLKIYYLRICRFKSYYKHFEGSLVGRMLYCDHKDMGSIPILHLFLFSLIGIALVFDIKGCRFESYKRHFRLVAEWFNVLVLKTKGFGPWVRIPPSPFLLVSLMVERVAVNHVMKVRFLHRPFFSGSLKVKYPAHNGRYIGSIPIRSIFPSSIIG